VAGVLAGSISAVFSKSLRLLALESRLAALSLSTMFCLAVIVALLFTSAWLALLAAAAVWLVQMTSIGWGLALALAALFNVALIFPVMLLIRRLSRNLLFNASRRQLGLGE
jgi:membrane protein implicated in regulation of membrane protease activity